MNMKQLKKKYKHGDIYTIMNFATDVKNEFFTSYDGEGYFINKLGEEAENVSFNYIDIINHANKYNYVVWYNK